MIIENVLTIFIKRWRERKEYNILCYIITLNSYTMKMT